MKKIKVIDSLYLSENGVYTKYKSNGKAHDFFIKQGDLDGACAPYSVSMILMLLGIIKRNEIGIRQLRDKRTRLGKLMSLFLDEKGLVLDGYDYKALHHELQGIKNLVKTTYHKGDNEAFFEDLKQKVANNFPLLMSLEYSGGAHALVAVGYEYDLDGDITKVLCLDPGFEKPLFTYWNSVIDVETVYTGKYKYKWLNSNSYVDIDDYICFER